MFIFSTFKIKQKLNCQLIFQLFRFRFPSWHSSINGKWALGISCIHPILTHNLCMCTIYNIFLYSIFVLFSGLSNLNVLSHNHAVRMRIVSNCVLDRCWWPESKKQLNHGKAVNTTKNWNELYHYVCKCSFHSPSSISNRLKQITDRPEHFTSFPSHFRSLIVGLWKGEKENFPVNITHRL